LLIQNSRFISISSNLLGFNASNTLLNVLTQGIPSDKSTLGTERSRRDFRINCIMAKTSFSIGVEKVGQVGFETYDQRVMRTEFRATFHRPHPKKETDKGALVSV
jgi:hypothetical protein